MGKIKEFINKVKNKRCKHEFERMYLNDKSTLVFQCRKCGKVVKSELFGIEANWRNAI